MTDEEILDFIQENQFAQISFLQHAQNHLMKAGGDGDLHVKLDGDFAAILTLQAAGRDLAGEFMRKYWAAGWDACAHGAIRIMDRYLDPPQLMVVGQQISRE